jgi:formyl-CoA transferase
MPVSLPKPLAGRIVADLSTMIAGPYAAMLLGDLGAEVIKVEQPSGDPARLLGPPPVVGEDSAAFHSVNRNKRSVVVDLTTSAGRDELHSLVDSADVVVHNALPRGAARLGIDGASLLARRPGLVVVEIGGFSRHGPDADRPAYDIIVAAMSGLMSVTGEVDGRPLRPGAPMIDVSTGVYAAFGAVTALVQRADSGVGQVVSVNMVDVAVNLQATNFAYHFATGEQPERKANGSYFAVSNCFATADSWIAVAVGNDPLWERLVDAIGDPSLRSDHYRVNQDRLRHAQEIEERLAHAFLRHDTAHWIEVLDGHRVPHAPILDYSAVVSYLKRCRHTTLWEFDRPDSGTVPVIGNPIEFSSAGLGVDRPPPRMESRSAPGDGGPAEEVR